MTGQKRYFPKSDISAGTSVIPASNVTPTPMASAYPIVLSMPNREMPIDKKATMTVRALAAITGVIWVMAEARASETFPPP